MSPDAQAELPQGEPCLCHAPRRHAGALLRYFVGGGTMGGDGPTIQVPALVPCVGQGGDEFNGFVVFLW